MHFFSLSASVRQGFSFRTTQENTGMFQVNRFASSSSLFLKIPMLISSPNVRYCNFRSLLYSHSYLFDKPSSVTKVRVTRFPVTQRSPLSVAASASEAPLVNSDFRASYRKKKKVYRESPECVLKNKIEACSAEGDLVEALRLYDEARNNGITLSQVHYNPVLYLCSGGASSSVESSGDVDKVNELKNLGLKRGLEIFKQMCTDKVTPNEATFTNMVRLAVAMEDPDMAFDIVKQMKALGLLPKLRSYRPILSGFCEKRNSDRSYEVDAHMAECGLTPEEPELSFLLKVSAANSKAEKVYEMLQRLRSTVRQVSESTLEIIDDWFKSEDAANVGAENWDVNKIKEGVVSGGGGWHGQGWLGSGRWNVVRTQVDDNGVCPSCGQRLVCIDIDPKETEDFARKLSELACKREVKANFLTFQRWLQRHGPFDSVIDGANVGLTRQLQNINFYQVNNVVNELRKISPTKQWPLVILHASRVYDAHARNSKNRSLLETWKNANALYVAPAGSNDDWYWLYAAVSNNCLVVTNDEMRDHLFQLLGTSFFPRWKEKHQVRISLSRSSGFQLCMPPPYSTVIQESECGSWHVPAVVQDEEIDTPRLWLCATRPNKKTS